MGFLRGGTNASNPPTYTGMNIQTSSEGMIVPVIYGSNLISPNLVWGDNFQKYSGGKKGGGGGKGGGKGGNFTYSAGVILAVCEGPVTFGNIWVDNTTVTTFSALNLTPYIGDSIQTPFGCISTLPGFVPIAYRYVAYLATNVYNLGSAAAVPQHQFEIFGFLAGTSGVLYDVNPSAIIYDICTNGRYGLGMPPALLGDFTQYSLYCTALGLMISPAMDKQEQAISIFQRWAQLTNSWIFWSENQMKIVPLGDTAITANGVTYTPINTIRYNLTWDDFISDKNEAPLTITRSEPSTAYNWTKINARDRSNAYSTATVEYKDQTSIDKYGLFQANEIEADEVCVRAIAATMVGLIGARALYIRNTYKFKLPYNFVLLEPGDIVTVSDPAIGLSEYPVRIRTVAEDDSGVLTFEAEECPSGTGVGIQMGHQASGAVALPALDVDPGPVNPPAIFEPPLSVTVGTPQVWIGASGGQYWGGANVFISVDDVTYIQAGVLETPTAQGVLLANLASHADPDTTNTLEVNCAESLQTLLSTVTHADADAGRSLALVDTELLAYGNVAVNGFNAFSSNLTYLRRGFYGTTIAAHSTGAPFSAIVPADMLQVNLPQAYVGQTIYVKLTSFNIFGEGTEDISSVTRYSYTPSGVGYTIAPPTSPALALTTPVGATSISLTLSWSASPGPGLGSYEVQMSADGGSTWTAADITVGPAATQYTLASCTPGANYQGRVRAISGNGLAASSFVTSSVVNAGASPSGGISMLPLVNGSIPIGIITDPTGVPVYVVQ
jgi:hypothetical protein